MVQRDIFLSSWLVLAFRPVKSAVSRRCEVWQSVGGGGWADGLNNDVIPPDLYRNYIRLGADSTVTVLFSFCH